MRASTYQNVSHKVINLAFTFLFVLQLDFLLLQMLICLENFDFLLHNGFRLMPNFFNFLFFLDYNLGSLSLRIVGLCQEFGARLGEVGHENCT